MATIVNLSPFVFKWEGGYTDHPNDPGGATNMGVTIGTAKMLGLKYDKDKDGKITKNDIKLLTKKDAEEIMKFHYWDKCKADDIKSQAVANILVDWFWMSGVNASKGIQRLVGVTVDGKVGPKTVEAINAAKESELVASLYKARADFYKTIISRNSKLKSFEKGWNNRLNDLIKYNKKYL